MKSQIGFIAVGQAGGNIGLLFEKCGYSVLFLNTYQEDLTTLKDAKHTYKIKDGEGCNKDRDKAKDLVINDFEAILEQIKEKLTEQYIYIIFSAGGGTGSGASPMLIDLMIQNTDKKVGAVIIIPSKTESLKTYINMYECFKELEEIDGIGATFILDNNKADNLSINKKFVDLFNAVTEVPLHRSIRGNIDTAEVKEMLYTRGAAIISKVSKDSTPMPRVIKSIHDNIFAPIEEDRVIKYIGLSAINSIDVSEIIKETGKPLDIFQGSNPINNICILSGLTFPYRVFEEMKKTIQENKEDITNSLKQTREAKLSDDINFLSDIGNPSSKSKININDVFSKYKKK